MQLQHIACIAGSAWHLYKKMWATMCAAGGMHAVEVESYCSARVHSSMQVDMQQVALWAPHSSQLRSSTRGTVTSLCRPTAPAPAACHPPSPSFPHPTAATHRWPLSGQTPQAPWSPGSPEQRCLPASPAPRPCGWRCPNPPPQPPGQQRCQPRLPGTSGCGEGCWKP